MGAATTMGFIKLVKNKAYYKRFQVKYKRRREGKTDYYARKRLVTQDKNKFGTPKYRFVVRFTNKDIICQVVSSKIKGDICHCAAYCVGLLCARRLLKKLGLDTKFVGTEEVTAEYEDCYVHNEEDEGEDAQNAFHALLDVGLKRTTLGSKIFAAMKGAFDGGLEIPHNQKKFYGYDADEKEYSAEDNRERILGGHVSSYMEGLKEEEPEEYEEKFKKYIQKGVDAEGMEDMYLNVHKAIRANPEHVPTEKKKPTGDDLTLEKREGGIRYTNSEGKKCFINRARRSLAQRKNRVEQKKAHVLNSLADDDDEEEEDEE